MRFFLVLCTAACTATSKAPPPCPPAPQPAAKPSATATEPVTKEQVVMPSPSPSTDPAIVAFDCSVDLDTKKGELLRNNDGPGPMGANWNWSGDLRCWIRTTGGCEEPTKDRAEIELGTLPAQQPSSIAAVEGGWRIEFVIPQGTWINHALKFERPRRGYCAVPIVGHVMLHCEEEGAPVLVDSFVGRFGFGE